MMEKVNKDPCSKCGYDGSPGDKYCRRCGLPLKDHCAICGHSVQPDDRFCTKCGASLLQGAALINAVSTSKEKGTVSSTGDLMQLICPHCHGIFRVGEDSFLVTDEDKFRSLSKAEAAVLIIGCPTRKPDLVMHWSRPTTPAEREEQQRRAAEIQVATAQGERRQWWCGKCHNETPNPYPDS